MRKALFILFKKIYVVNIFPEFHIQSRTASRSQTSACQDFKEIQPGLENSKDVYPLEFSLAGGVLLRFSAEGKAQKDDVYKIYNIEKTYIPICKNDLG